MPTTYIFLSIILTLIDAELLFFYREAFYLMKVENKRKYRISVVEQTKQKKMKKTSAVLI